MDTWGQPQAAEAVAPVHIDSALPMMMDGLPVDLINYFGVEMGTITQSTRKHLSEIYAICCTESPRMGDILQKIRSLDNRMGEPSLGQTRTGRIWQYLKMHEKVVDMQKNRDAMLRY